MGEPFKFDGTLRYFTEDCAKAIGESFLELTEEEKLRSHSHTVSFFDPKPVTISMQLDGVERQHYEDMLMRSARVNGASLEVEYSRPDRVRTRPRLLWLTRRRRLAAWAERHGLAEWKPGVQFSASMPCVEWDLARFSDEEMP